MNIAVEVNGQEINSHRIGDAVESAVVHSVADTINRHVSSMRCPTHGVSVKVTLIGSDPAHLCFKVTGCCQHFVNHVTDKLQ